MKCLDNSKGLFIIGLTLVSGLVAFIFISATSSKMANYSELNAQSKVLLDAQMAIDKFAFDLKKAYDLATPPPDSQGGDASAVIYSATATWPLSETENIKFYLPNGDNKVCVSRSDARDAEFLIAGTQVNKICVLVPGDLFARVEDNQLYVDFRWEETQARPSYLERMQLLSKFFKISSATAAAGAIYEPDIPSGQGVVSLVNVNRDGDAIFQMRYGSHRCDLNLNSQFCININICVKYGGACSSEEYIKQTYVFARVPEKSMSN